VTWEECSSKPECLAASANFFRIDASVACVSNEVFKLVQHFAFQYESMQIRAYPSPPPYHLDRLHQFLAVVHASAGQGFDRPHAAHGKGTLVKNATNSVVGLARIIAKDKAVDRQSPFFRCPEDPLERRQEPRISCRSEKHKSYERRPPEIKKKVDGAARARLIKTQ
jgi:hypothetical protein